MQLLPDITHTRFSLIRFRSPLLTESRLLSLPVGTEMFHFPTFPLPARDSRFAAWRADFEERSRLSATGTDDRRHSQRLR